ncbi:MAG: thiamine pyrophosphate-dependent enzyme [Gemmatales bacterium]|nr:thiamine pyrophosphate-dependent enzyme [Gemmatales bacterium]MDW8387864.1 thiamine pyrophosphate-dependent enzyme [Gemmatales bacterium]
MELREALEVLARHRGDKVVITTMASVAVWPTLSDTPLDFNYIPSSMGQGPALGLGLALAVPSRGVIVVNGDGSMLMNLGSLVTVAAYPANLYLLIMQNDLYEVTGGQPLVGAGRVDYAGLARAAGIRRTYAFDTLADWSQQASEVLSGPGPVACCLKIAGRMGQKTPKPPRPMQEQIARLRHGLGVA